MRPIVAFLSDFGTRDHYVGAVKGAVLCACPDATIVDVAHEIAAHDVVAASHSLAAVHRAFPGGTVFIAVVDPGVGSARRALAADAGGYRFVAPDNGLLTMVLAAHPDARVREITNTALFRHEVSATFHARDIFAPVAGRLAGGMPLEDVGPEATDLEQIDVPAARKLDDREWEATIVSVDRFGNLATSLTAAQLQEILDTVGGDPTEIVVTAGEGVLPLVLTYADVTDGEPCALLGSSGLLEVAVSRGSAATELGLARGGSVRVRVVSARD